MEKELREIFMSVWTLNDATGVDREYRKALDLITRYADERAKRAIAWYREKIAEVPRDRITEQALLEAFKKES